MEVAYGRHAWRGVYLNDGRGNGYFAPGWDGRRLARNMRRVQRILTALTVAVALFFTGWVVREYQNNINYYRLAKSGVAATAVVGAVGVEHSYRAGRSTNRYVTETTAEVRYQVDGQVYDGVLEDRMSYGDSYPEPEWATGESVLLYTEPGEPESFVEYDAYLEDRDGPFTGAMVFLAAIGSLLVSVFATVALVARSSRRKAEAL